MEYEEIKIDESYEVNGSEYKVVYKHNESKSVFTIDVRAYFVLGWSEDELVDFKPLKTNLLDKVTSLANEFGNFSVEQTKSGVIVISPLGE